MEFRGSFYMFVITNSLWVGLQLIVIEVYFQYTEEILGWTKYQVLFLIGMFRIVKGIFDVFLRTNLLMLHEHVNRGDLDYALIKPLNSLFLISTRHHRFSELASITIGILIIGYAVSGNVEITILTLALILGGIILGVIAFYSIMLLFATLSIFMTRLSAIRSYYDILSNTVRFPTDILGVHHRLFGIFILPLAAVVTMPSAVVLGKSPATYLIIEIIVSSGLFILAYGFWHYALRHYSSASS